MRRKDVKKKGSSILLVLIIMMTILAFSTTSISATMHTTKINNIKVQEDSLFYAAESGFEHGYANLMKNNSETDYFISVDNSNVKISIKKEADNLYRIKSEATKNTLSKVVQGLVEDKSTKTAVVSDYADLIEKYTINTKTLGVGINGSANLLYVNSATDMVVSSGIQVGIYDQPFAKPEDKLFSVPPLKMKHDNKLEFNSTKEFIDFGEGKRNDKANNSVITTDIEFTNNGSAKYKVIFVNADYLKINIPERGEVLTKFIIISSGSVEFNSLVSGATYGYSSVICKDFKISNYSRGAINFNPPPYFYYQENKDDLNKLIGEFLESETSSSEGIEKWEIKEMSY